MPENLLEKNTKKIHQSSYFSLRITSKGQKIMSDAMEVILIDQNRSDSFLLKFFLDEIDFVTDIKEFDEYGQVLAYLNGKAEAQFTGNLTVFCTENIKKNRGIDFLAFLSGEYPQLKMYRILTGEDRENAKKLIHSRQIDEYLEKKIELDDFGIETNRVILKAKRSSQSPKMASLLGRFDTKQDLYTSSAKASNTRFKFSIKSITPTCVFRLFADQG